MNKCLVFTVSGSFARFRKPYTTTSALTFMCIHPIAVRGMLGAILGIDKSELFSYFKQSKVGIEVINNIRKDMGSFNLTNMKTNHIFRFPSNVEFLRDVKYRIYFQDSEDKLLQIKEAMQTHRYIFTPYLGNSEHLAKLVAEDIAIVEKADTKETRTVIPKSQAVLENIAINKIYTDKLPVVNNEKREYTTYEQVVIPVLGEKLQVSEDILFKVGEQIVYFF